METKHVFGLLLLISIILNLILIISLFPSDKQDIVTLLEVCVLDSDCGAGNICKQSVLCEQGSDNCVSAKYCQNLIKLDGNECTTNAECKTKNNENWKCSNGNCYCPETDNFDPVCGIDGVTYSNPSRPNCMGIKIAYQGECRDTSICGNGILEKGEDCDWIGGFDSCIAGCTSDCICPDLAPSVCGNGILEGGEDCDGKDWGSCIGGCNSDCTCKGDAPPR